MQRLQAYKYELMPDGKQQRDMRRFAGRLWPGSQDPDETSLCEAGTH